MNNEPTLTITDGKLTTWLDCHITPDNRIQYGARVRNGRITASMGEQAMSDDMRVATPSEAVAAIASVIRNCPTTTPDDLSLCAGINSSDLADLSGLVRDCPVPGTRVHRGSLITRSRHMLPLSGLAAAGML